VAPVELLDLVERRLLPGAAGQGRAGQREEAIGHPAHGADDHHRGRRIPYIGQRRRVAHELGDAADTLGAGERAAAELHHQHG